MGLLEDIKARLVAQNVGTTGATSTGWRIVYRELQPTNAQQIAIVPTGGFQEEGRPPLTYPTFQLLIRGSSSATSALETKVDAAIDALNHFDGALNGWIYADIRVNGHKNYLGRDTNQRPLYSVNFTAWRSRD